MFLFPVSKDAHFENTNLRRKNELATFFFFLIYIRVRNLIKHGHLHAKKPFRTPYSSPAPNIEPKDAVLLPPSPQYL